MCETLWSATTTSLNPLGVLKVHDYDKGRRDFIREQEYIDFRLTNRTDPVTSFRLPNIISSAKTLIWTSQDGYYFNASFDQTTQTLCPTRMFSSLECIWAPTPRSVFVTWNQQRFIVPTQSTRIP